MHNPGVVHTGGIQAWIMELTCNYIYILKYSLEKEEEIESGFPNLSKGRSACIVDPNCQVAIKFNKGKSL